MGVEAWGFGDGSNGLLGSKAGFFSSTSLNGAFGSNGGFFGMFYSYWPDDGFHV